MKLLNSILDLDAFFDRLRKASQRVLLLDYDGTLAPFRAEREQAAPYPRIPPLLDEIVRCRRSRLAIVSGRATTAVAALLGLKRTPEIFGSHGAERLSIDGTYRSPTVPDATRAVLGEAYQWAGDQGLQRQTELKPAGIAFHWRGLEREAAERIRQSVRTQSSRWSDRSGLELREFDGGLELRLPGITKGDVVRTVLAESDDQAVVAYLGDDTTDEDAFETLAGRGLSILVRTELRPTKADLWLIPPEDLVSFLHRWLESCK